MQIPEKYKRYLTGTFVQGDEIQARFNNYLSVLQGAMGVMGQNQLADTPLARTLYRENATLMQDAQACLAGACQCLAIKWLKLKMKEQAAGLTGKDKVSADDRLDKLKDPARLDKVIKKMRVTLGVQVFTMSFEEALRQFNVAAKPYWDAPVALKKLCKTVMSQSHAYFVVGIKCPTLGDSDKHAIAVYTSDGGFLGTGKNAHVFDPNIGEIRFPLSDFGTLFPGLISECYGTGENDVVVFAQLVA